MSEKTLPASASDQSHQRLQRIVSLAENGDVASMRVEVSGISEPPLADEAWALFSRINANTQRLDVAMSALEIALQQRPQSPILRLERALLNEQQGLLAKSMEELASLAHAHPDSPRLLGHLARTRASCGQAHEAEAMIEAALIRWPIDVPLHQLLAQLRWQRDAGESFTAILEQAIAAYPRELQLRLVAADLLRNAGFLQKALGLLERGLASAPESPVFLTSVGVMLENLGRPEAALPYLLAAVERTPGNALNKRNLVPTLLRLNRGDEALRVCDELLTLAADDQQLIAYRATALRLLGDGSYATLFDYSRLVRVYRPPAPPGFADMASFNAAFSRELTQLHGTTQRPLGQSLRGGSQTDRNLPPGNPVVAAFFAAVDGPIRDYVSHLRSGDAAHPTDRRKGKDYRLSGSWSVQLQPHGYHTNHVHPQGWLSSAYYVELPDEVSDDTSRAGWLKFGEPGISLTGCTPEHFVKPAPGMLVLFPSFMWHGTVPFTKGGRRLTAAFDVVPA